MAAATYFSLEHFCLRQFNPTNTGYIRYDPDAFIARVNEIYAEMLQSNSNISPLRPGYAPFCKHVFIPNFTDTEAYAIEITDGNRHLLEYNRLLLHGRGGYSLMFSRRSDYVARTSQELPVLTRWFPKYSPFEYTPSVSLDIILYSREQIIKENAATGEKNVHPESLEWGVISVKAQMSNDEIPMAPITMMRNALPLCEGGSGTPLDHDKYIQSVQTWKHFAVVI